jgi:simple sugar transport system substrate-binding protein
MLTTPVAFVLIFAGCGAVVQSGPGSSSGAGTPTTGFHLAGYIQNDIQSHKKLVIRVDYHDPSLGFAVPIRQGVDKAAQDLGIDAPLIGPAGGSASDQVAELQTLITQQKIDALAVSSASNDALKPVIAQAYNAGIPIISFNTDNPGSKEMAFVGQDLVASGQSEAQQLVKLLNGKKGKVVVFSVDTGGGWSHDRFNGFQAGISSATGIQVIGPVNTGNEPSQAYNVVQNTMTANSDAIALVSLDCCSLDAAAKWVQQSHMGGKVTVVGFDLLPQTVSYIQSGVIQATISQNPFQQGYQSVKLLYDFLTTNAPLHNINTGALLVTEANLKEVPAEG